MLRVVVGSLTHDKVTVVDVEVFLEYMIEGFVPLSLDCGLTESHSVAVGLLYLVDLIFREPSAVINQWPHI